MTSQNNFSAMPPPIRTNTVGSQTSQSSDQMSPTSPASPTSPTSRDFFGALSARVRGHSRSRSRDAAQRSNTPMVSPPRQMPSTSTPAQPQHARHASATSTTQPTRPGLQTSDRTGSDPWRGRHSNEWLFGGWSATETVKDVLRRKS